MTGGTRLTARRKSSRRFTMAFAGDQPITHITDHAVGAVFLQSHHNGRLVVLAHDYTGRWNDGELHTTLRLPLGKGKPGESIGATLNREMIEEVAAEPGDFDFEILSPAPLYWEVVPHDATGERSHLKVVFAARIKRGHIRNFACVDDAGTFEEETHGPLQFLEITRVLSRMWKEKSPRVHRLAVVGALYWCARQNPRIAEFYRRLRDERARDLAAFEPYHPVVNEYLARG